MKDTPINSEVVSEIIRQSGIENVGRATIRVIKRLIDQIEAKTGDKYVRMEMGEIGRAHV